MTRTSKQATTKETPIADEDLSLWVDSAVPALGCHTCKHTSASGTLQRLLKAMAARGTHTVTLRQLHAKLREVHGDYKIGYWGFRDHLRFCEKDLYAEAKAAKIYA